MTAPRMTDEAVAAQWGALGSALLRGLRADHLRARSAESAALARVRRQEEALAFALRESGCDGDLCCHEWHARARAALSEET